MLTILTAKKEYNGDLVLDIPHLQLVSGVYWLQGINGSGKTTLLRMIAGLVPFKGDIQINGISLCSKPLHYRREVSWAPAEPLYPPFVTGAELVGFYREIRKAASQQVDRLVTFFGIRSYLSNPVSSYSSGMVKRLSLLLAFIGEASLILLDEPLATLDVEAAHLLPTLIHERRQNDGASFIFTSHQSVISDELAIDKSLSITSGTVHFNI